MGDETLDTELKLWGCFARGREHVKELGQGVALQIIIIISSI